MSDNTVYYGTPEFAVDLQAMSDAIGTVSTDRDGINSDITAIMTAFQTCESAWTSPAGTTFADFKSTLSSSTQSLMNLLDDMITRMKTTYQNYEAAENSNVNNLT